MAESTFYVCMKEGHRFASENVEEMLCPFCGGDLFCEAQMRMGLGPEQEEAESDLPEDAEKAAKDPGNRLGDFILVKKMGEGTSGRVYKAWQKRLRRYVALKLLHIAEPMTIRRLEREAQLLAQLQHSNIAGIHEIGEIEGRRFLVMHFIDGGPINQALPPLEELFPVFVKICRAVDFAHLHQIIHRDIKPGNILLDKDHEPYVTDFGLARALQASSSLTGTRDVVGTPLFMSPEQARGRIHEIDEQSDIFSLGATFYCLVTGRSPFDADDIAMILAKVISADPELPRKIIPEIPLPVESIIMKAMEKEKNRRYASAGEMADDFGRFLNGDAVTAKSQSGIRRFGRKVRNNPWPVAISTAVLFTVIMALFQPWADTDSENPGNPDPVAGSGWRDRFEPLQQKLDYFKFETASPELIQNTRTVLSQIPDSLVEEVASWFRNQEGHLPDKVWPRRIWLDKKSEARRILEWCGTMDAILEGLGGDFEPVRSRLAASTEIYAPVAAYLGAITLKILFRPYAELRALRVGEVWVVRNGEKLESESEISGEGLFTPLVIRDLDIGTYTLVLAHPDLGEREFRIESDKLGNGEVYVYSGSLSNPNSVRLRILP